MLTDRVLSPRIVMGGHSPSPVKGPRETFSAAAGFSVFFFGGMLAVVAVMLWTIQESKENEALQKFPLLILL